MRERIRTLNVDELWEEIRPYLEEGGYLILYGDECVSNGEAVIAFDPSSLATYVYPIESAAPENVRRWDAFWRLCSFCNRRSSKEVR